jgi:uncharacterized protein YqfA (UPF0365 family)
MNKSYVVVPLAAIALFGSLYWSYSARREDTLRTQVEQAAAARAEQAERDREAQVASVAAANAALDQRKQERLEKEQRDAAQKQAQHEAEQRREHAFEQERKLRSQVDRRRADLDRTRESLRLLNARQQEITAESTFLTDYVKQAEANQESLYQLLEKIDAAERARSTAATNPPPPIANRNS